MILPPLKYLSVLQEAERHDHAKLERTYGTPAIKHKCDVVKLTIESDPEYAIRTVYSFNEACSAGKLNLTNGQ
jgi:hypothetical protein